MEIPAQLTRAFITVPSNYSIAPANCPYKSATCVRPRGVTPQEVEVVLTQLPRTGKATISTRFQVRSHFLHLLLAASMMV